MTISADELEILAEGHPVFDLDTAECLTEIATSLQKGESLSEEERQVYATWLRITAADIRTLVRMVRHAKEQEKD